MLIGPGTRLGTYEVIAELGAGGMGQVYRARDTRLGREVALKIVHPHLSHDPEQVRRFRREAEILASLTHPHVAAVYALEETESFSYLVMELVPGETLREKLARGPLTVAEALHIAAQVADAVEAAHEKGVIHRDLKPSNVKITPQGVAKVLDFGLAKIRPSELGPYGTGAGAELAPPNLSHSPTVTVGGTREGVILGTAAYMSPEQARGRPAGRGADIWAFGCVMFEMLTNHRAFSGETLSDTIVSLLEREPNWELLPDAIPPNIQRLLRRCLQKELPGRLRDIGDARLEIEEGLAAPGTSPEHTAAATGRRRGGTIGRTLAVLAIGGSLGALVAASLKTTRLPPQGAVAHFALSLPANTRLANLDFPAAASSPDGSSIAYVATGGGRPQLFLRPLDSLEAKPLPGTADAIGPFFSPDSRWIGFFADGQLKKVPVGGGVPIVVCDAPIGFGATWGSGDTIVFAATSGSGLSRVPAAGGQPTRATTLNEQKGEFSHRWPELLPDGDTVLYTVGTVGSWDDAQIVAESLSTGQRRVLIQGGTNPHYVATGRLLYARGGAIFAVPFDPSALTVSGTPVRVLENVLQSFDGAAQLGISLSGSLVYVAGRFDTTDRQLMTVDRSGNAIPFAAPARAYSAPRISPDGQKLLVATAGATEALWLYDMARGALNQLPFDASNSFPVWAPDGLRVAFSSNRAGALNLFRTRVDGTSAHERLAPSETVQLAGSWSPDGQVLAFVERHPTSGRDIWMLPLTGNQRPYPFLNGAFDESAPRFSPDGRFVAYVSNESGRNEVYVRSLADRSRVRQVSTSGGIEPVWATKARELFYRMGDQMMIVRLGPAGEPADSPQMLFRGDFESGTLDLPNYDVFPDGQRFVLVRAIEGDPTRELHIMLNWRDRLVSALRSSGQAPRP